MIRCRFDNSRVGHYPLSLRIQSIGRLSNYEWLWRFFTPEGEVAQITLAPAIDSISPQISSTQGKSLKFLPRCRIARTKKLSLFYIPCTTLTLKAF